MNNNEQTPDLTDLQILVVEDEAPIALQLEDMLTELGAAVVGPASRVRQALQLLQEQTVDAAVLDLNIAGELVYPVAEALETTPKSVLLAGKTPACDVTLPRARSR